MLNEQFVSNVKKDFGNRLRQARRKANYTQERLGEELGFSSGTVSNWETGERIPDWETLCRIRAVLGVSIDRLLCGNDNEIQHHTTQVFANQAEANDDIINFIKEQRPSVIYLIQYSSYNVSTVLENFVRYTLPESSPKIYLLLKYPGIKAVKQTSALRLRKFGVHTVDPFQFRKTWGRLEALLRVDKMPYLEIKCYYAPAAIRAVYLGYPIGEKLRNFDPNRLVSQTENNVGLLSLSLFRYTGREGEVVGQDNPLIHTRSDTAEGKTLYSLFEENFLDLWNDSEKGMDVIDKISEESGKKSRK